jgi:CHAT domain-containing protein
VRVPALTRIGPSGALLFLLTACGALPFTGADPAPPAPAERDGGQDAAFAGRLLREAEARQQAGDLAEARRLAERAADEARSMQAPWLEAAADAVLGNVLLAAGERATAREHLERASAGAAAAGTPAIEAAARLNLGNLERLEGQLAPALSQYDAASALARAGGEPVLAARAQASALRARALLGSPASGTSLASADGVAAVAATKAQILALASPRVRAGLALHASESISIPLEAEPAAAASLASAARELLDAAAIDADVLRDPALSAEIAGSRGRLARIEGRPDEALRLTEEALLASQQAGSEADRIPWHVQAAELLRAAGRPEEALAQQAEAVRLLQVHRQALTQEARAQGADPRAFQQMRSTYLGYVDLLLARAGATPDASARQADLSRARDTLEAFKAQELRDYFEDECVDAYRGRIERVEDVAAGTAVLYPILFPDRLELLVSSAHGMTQFRVEVGEAELRATVGRLRELLVQRTTRRYLVPSWQLYDWLIRPLEPLLEQDRVTTLVFVPDGPLRTIPIAALHDRERFLIERYAIAITPGIELTDPRALGSEHLAALLGGLSVAREEFAALPNVASELARVHELVGGEVLLDERFRSASVEERIAEHDFDLVHLATHAQFEAESSSGFLLTFDGRIGLDALAESLTGSRFRERPLELLVLSACETARGDERAALGLSGIAIKAGARSALGSLWMVSDQATADLLVRFYQALREPGASRAEALRSAQLALLHQPVYRHPIYWSGFLLLNSWL